MNLKYLLVVCFHIVPKAFLSRIFGYAARICLPASVLRILIRHYCVSFGVNVSEMEIPEKGFTTFDQFFTRRLKPGARLVDSDPAAVVSPVDGRIDQFGKITDMQIIQAKGIDFRLCDLIPEPYSRMFENGLFLTVYLSPGDYHRIHSPVDGFIECGIHIPGKLFPVSECMVNGIKGLFTKNERIITLIRMKSGICAVCKIGAMNVGRISVEYSDLTANTSAFRKSKTLSFPSNEALRLKKGDHLATFHIGSTVILLFSQKSARLGNLYCGQKVRVGENIGMIPKPVKKK